MTLPLGQRRRVTGRTGSQDLESWLTVIEADDGQPDLRSLAAGIRNDQQAVTNGPSLPYSSGKVEGTINKIKMIKRQMYGRAGFVLLRKRVILHPALPGSQNSRKSQNWWPPARRKQDHPTRFPNGR